MAITFLESGGNATYGTEPWTAINGTLTIDSTIFHTGLRSIKSDSTASNIVASVRRAGVLADAGRRLSHYRYFTQLPTADANIIGTTNSSNATTIFRLQLRTTGVLRFVGSANGADGTVTIPTGQWMRIAIAYTITSTTVNEFRCWVDTGSGPVLAATATNLTLAATGTDQVILGYSTTPGANVVTYVSDVYIDNTATLTDPGDVRVTAKLPTTINVNTFDTTVGTGLVNQRPIVTTSNRTQGGTGTATCNFNIETDAAGDVDISGATLLGYLGWIWAAKGTGGGTPTDNITVNGVDTVVALTTSAAFYSALVTSASYPSNAAGIGMNRTVGAAADCNFFEGGVIVAYIPGTAAATPFGYEPWQVAETPRRIEHVPY